MIGLNKLSSTLLLISCLTLSSSCHTQKPTPSPDTKPVLTEKTNSIKSDIDYILKGQFRQKIFVYFDEYATIVYLDNTLSEIKRLDLEELGYWDVQGATVARDNNIWLLDYDNLRLIKINEGGQIELSSNEQTEGIAVVKEEGLALHAKNNQVYLTSQTGVAIYDEFGTYLLYHPLKNDLMHFADNRIIYADGKQIKIYDLKVQFKEATAALVGLETEPLGFILNRRSLFVIDAQGFYAEEF